MYKYELHCHTGDVSLCAKISPEDLVRRYDKAGYSGLVLTNHFSPMTFWRTGMFATKKQIARYLSAYDRIRAFAGTDFTALLGLELRHYGTVNDYLVYGVDESWLLTQTDMLFWNEKKMSERLHGRGYLVYQAHPFRPMFRRCDPLLLDGVEVFNGHTEMPGNAQALAWARFHKKAMISGSDTHREEDPISGGICTDVRIRSNEDLLSVLRSEQYRLLGEFAV